MADDQDQPEQHESAKASPENEGNSETGKMDEHTATDASGPVGEEDRGWFDEDDALPESDEDDALPESDEDDSPRRPSVDIYQLGTVTLHHPSRDVVTLMDWGAARRVLKIFEQRREGSLGDVLSFETSQPQAAWVVADLEEFVAVSWMPGLPKKPSRTVIDPVVDDAA